MSASISTLPCVIVHFKKYSFVFLKCRNKFAFSDAVLASKRNNQIVYKCPDSQTLKLMTSAHYEQF